MGMGGKAMGMGGKAIKAAGRLAGGHPQAARFPLPHATRTENFAPPRAQSTRLRRMERPSVSSPEVLQPIRGTDPRAAWSSPAVASTGWAGEMKSQHQGRCLDRGEALRKEGDQRFGDRHGRIGVAGTATTHPAGAGLSTDFHCLRISCGGRGWSGLGHRDVAGGRLTPT